MVDGPSGRTIVCTLLLALMMVTAGCPNPWQDMEYEATGKVVEDPPEDAAVLHYNNESVRSEEIIQQVVAEAIVAYENRTGTPAPRRLYDTSRELTKSQYRELNGTIAELDHFPGDNETAIYVQRAGYVVEIKTRTITLV
jgi:hypothetical protein